MFCVSCCHGNTNFKCQQAHNEVRYFERCERKISLNNYLSTKLKMTDEVSPEVIKRTQKTLGKYIKKPPLTEKLLKKPPFRFLHDVVHGVINETGFLKGLYSEEELISENVKDKDAKIGFLNKLIEATKTLSKTNLSVRASKVVAGLEPTNTNLLLQAIAKSIDSKTDSEQYVSQLKSDNKHEKSKKSQIPKAEKSKSVKSSNKDEKDSKTSKTSKRTTVIETPKSNLSTPKDSKGKISSRKEDDTKHKTGRRGREEKKDTKDMKSSKSKESQKTKESPKTEDSPSTDSIKKKSNKNEPIIRRNSFTVEPKNKDENTEKEVVTKNEHSRKNSLTVDKNKHADNHTVQNNEGIEDQKKSTDEILTTNTAISDKYLGNGQDEKNSKEVEESTKSLVRPKSARPKSGDMKINSASKEKKGNNEDGSKRLGNGIPQTKPLAPPSRPKSSLRPPSVRPSSARPGAPRLRPDSALPLQEPIAMGNINVIVERVDSSTVDEEETVVIETAPAEPEVVPEVTVDLDNKGHLVEQILEQLEESGGRKRTEIDWEPDVAARTKEGAAKDITQLSGLIQNLTKTANPLGRLINYLHEDIEAMHSELQMWVNTKKQLYAEIRKQKRSSAESNKPLLSHLDVLNQDIKKLQQEITQINGNIIKNDTRIKELLCK